MAEFLRLVERTRLYRSWVPRKAVTMLAPVSERLAELNLRDWPSSRIELFVLRHTLPGRLHWNRLAAKSRLVTLSGDLLPLGSRHSAADWLHLIDPDVMVEGMLLHVVDLVFPPSVLLGQSEASTQRPRHSHAPQSFERTSDAQALTLDLSRKLLSFHQQPGIHLLRRGDRS